MVAPAAIVESVGPTRRVGARDALQWAAFSLPVLIFLVAGWAHRTVTEDAFIYLRVVRQI